MLLLDDFRNGRLGQTDTGISGGRMLDNKEEEEKHRTFINWMAFISVSDYRACISHRNICRTAYKSQRTFHAEYTP